MKKVQVAFTLLEILVVITIIGIIIALIVPRLAHHPPQAEWSTILNDLNDVVYFARQAAISDQKVCRLLFKSNQNSPDTVTIQEEADDPERPGKKIYTAISSHFFNTTYTFHESVKLKAVYHGKVEEFADNKGQGFCYIIHDGLVQDILIHLVRKDKNVEMPASLKIMPFFGKFEFHDGHVRPEG